MKARAKIEADELPNAPYIARNSYGPDDPKQRVCRLCDQAGDAWVQLRDPAHDTAAGKLGIFLHFECHAAWAAELDSTDKAKWLLEAARRIAAKDPEFHAIPRHPTAGISRTKGFMAELRIEAWNKFGFEAVRSEHKVGGKTRLAVDFYFPHEETIVEVALGLPNEFEKDVLKAIMAKEFGHKVCRLVFISRPGSAKKCKAPGRRAVIQWAREKHGLTIEVFELEGKARIRKGRDPEVVQQERERRRLEYQRMTTPGYINRNDQEVVRVIRATDMPGTQNIYVLGCRRCGHAYGANGSDVAGRQCPNCQGGADGLPISN